MRKWIQDQRGQALVEMAIVVPILLLIVFGIIEFGYIYYHQLDITSAARMGARSAAVKSSSNDYIVVQDLAVQLGVLKSDLTATTGTTVIHMPNQANPYITWTWTNGSDTGTGEIEVTRDSESVTMAIGYPVFIVAPFIDRAFSGHQVIDLRSSAVMNSEV